MTQSKQLEHIWHIYRREGYAALRTTVPATDLEAFYLSLLAYGHDDFEKAEEHMQHALQTNEQNPVYRHALPVLQRIQREGKCSVYASQEAFGAYIHGGGNVPLYRQVSDALSGIYNDYAKLHLLDIGVGDGMALLPALNRHVERVSLIEPSHTLLSQALVQLDEYSMPYQAYVVRLQFFVCQTAASWDLAQATFSLQSISPSERPPLLHWMAGHCRRLLLVEFDVPQFEHMYHPQHVCSVLQRMQQGLNEYEDERELVAQGFMMPVMLGFFDRSAARTNYEQPLDSWLSQLKTAGFTNIETRTLYPYWWAPAFLIDARS